MNESSSSSEKRSATTPANAVSTRPPAKLTEQQFLQQQAAQAQLAISEALREMGENLGHGLNPVVWTKRHPYAVLGTAAAAGIVTVRLLQRERRPKPEPEQVPASSDNNGESEVKASNGSSKRRGSAITRRLLVEAIKLIRPLVTGFVMAQARSRPPEPSTNDLDDSAWEKAAGTSDDPGI